MEYPGYPGWDVETSHPITEPYDAQCGTTCADLVKPTLDFAIDWGSHAHSHTETDPNGDHVVVVRYTEPEAEPEPQP